MKTQLHFDGGIISVMRDGRNKGAREEARSRLDAEAGEIFEILNRALSTYQPTIVAETKGYNLHQGKRQLIHLQHIGNQFGETPLESIGVGRLLYHFSPERLVGSEERRGYRYLNPFTENELACFQEVPRILKRVDGSSERHLLHLAIPFDTDYSDFNQRIATQLFAKEISNLFHSRQNLFYGTVALGEGLISNDRHYEESLISFDAENLEKMLVEPVFEAGKKVLETMDEKKNIIDELRREEERSESITSGFVYGLHQYFSGIVEGRKERNKKEIDRLNREFYLGGSEENERRY